MNFFLKNTFKYLLGLVVAIGGLSIIIAGFGFLMFGDTPDCSEGSEAVAYARAIPIKRLEKLYEDMKRDSKDPEVPLLGYQALEEDESLPEPYSDLKFRKVRPSRAYIMLEGCIDHAVLLKFKGFKIKDKSSPKIILSWGEGPAAGREVLWEK